MNTDVAATTELKDQVRSLDVASKDSSAQIWPKKFNLRLTRLTGKDKTNITANFG